MEITGSGSDAFPVKYPHSYNEVVQTLTGSSATTEASVIASFVVRGKEMIKPVAIPSLFKMHPLWKKTYLAIQMSVISMIFRQT